MKAVTANMSDAPVRVSLKDMVGAGDRMAVFVLPFLAVGIGLNIWRPEWFAVGGPSEALRWISIVMLVPGVIVWLWSVALIITKVPRGELITGGPYAFVKHPLYTGVSLLVLPWAGFLLNTWLGVAFGAVLYLSARLYSPAEERTLAAHFGQRWEAYAMPKPASTSVSASTAPVSG